MIKLLTVRREQIIKIIVSSAAFILAFAIILIIMKYQEVDYIWKIAISAFILIVPFSFFVQALMTDKSLKEQKRNEIRYRLFQIFSRNKIMIEKEINKDLYLNETFWDVFRIVSNCINDPDLREDYRNAYGILLEDPKQKLLAIEFIDFSVGDFTINTKPGSSFDDIKKYRKQRKKDVSFWIRLSQVLKSSEIESTQQLKVYNEIQQAIFNLEVGLLETKSGLISYEEKIRVCEDMLKTLLFDLQINEQQLIELKSIKLNSEHIIKSDDILEDEIRTKASAELLRIKDDIETKTELNAQLRLKVKHIKKLLSLLITQSRLELEASRIIMSARYRLNKFLDELQYDNSTNPTIISIHNKLNSEQHTSSIILLTEYLEDVHNMQFYVEEQIKDLLHDDNQKQKYQNFQRRREFISLSLPDDITNRIVQKKIEKENLDFNSYFLPLSFFSIIYLVGILITLPLLNSIFTNQPVDIFIPLIDNKIPFQVIQWGFLGGLVYTSIHLLYRFLRGDISPKVYLYGSFRIIYAIVSAIIVFFIFSSNVSNSFTITNSNSYTYMLLICFIMGIAPIQFLIRIGEYFYLLFLKLSNKDKVGKHMLTAEIEGINFLTSERLTEEGISTVQEMAFCNPVEISDRTKLPRITVIDWKDQALLILFTGNIKLSSLNSNNKSLNSIESLYNLLNRLGIRTHSSLKKIWNSTKENEKKTFLKHLRLISDDFKEEPIALIKIFDTITSYEDKYYKMMEAIRMEWQSYDLHFPIFSKTEEKVIE